MIASFLSKYSNKKLIRKHVSHSSYIFPSYESLLVQDIEIVDTFLNSTSPNISPICENILVKEDVSIDNHDNHS